MSLPWAVQSRIHSLLALTLVAAAAATAYPPRPRPPPPRPRHTRRGQGRRRRARTGRRPSTTLAHRVRATSRITAATTTHLIASASLASVVLMMSQYYCFKATCVIRPASRGRRLASGSATGEQKPVRVGEPHAEVSRSNSGGRCGRREQASCGQACW